MEDLWQLNSLRSTIICWLRRVYKGSNIFWILRPLAHEDFSITNSEWYGKTEPQLDAVRNETLIISFVKRVCSVGGEKKVRLEFGGQKIRLQPRKMLLAKLCFIFHFSTWENYNSQISWRMNGAIWKMEWQYYRCTLTLSLVLNISPMMLHYFFLPESTS